jgi:predicted nucleic-acid-binding Zn-ribbon protein
LKKTLQCPKCDSRRIWHVERVATYGGMQLALEYEHGLTGRGALELFSCDACGYSELYANTANLIERKGIRLIDTSKEPELR